VTHFDRRNRRDGHSLSRPIVRVRAAVRLSAAAHGNDPLLLTSSPSQLWLPPRPIFCLVLRTVGVRQETCTNGALG